VPSSVKRSAGRYLSNASNSPMHQYGWIKACGSAFSDDGRLQLIAWGRPNRGQKRGPIVYDRAFRSGLIQLPFGGRRRWDGTP
jgi:hypothetical protein